MSEINSTRLIADAERRFKELERKGWEWRSFYNGWLECFGTYCAKPALTPLEIELGEALEFIVKGLGIVLNNEDHIINKALAHYHEAKGE